MDYYRMRYLCNWFRIHRNHIGYFIYGRLDFGEEILMEMREIISTFEATLKTKLVELSRMEKEVAILRSTINNDLRALQEILKHQCKDFIQIQE